MSYATLKTLVEFRERTLQRGRIGMGNRVAAVVRGDSVRSSEEVSMLRKWERVMLDGEQSIDDDIIHIASQIPIIAEIEKVKGIGTLYAAKLVAEIDITRCGTVSALWKRCGLGLGEYWVDKDKKILAPKVGYRWVDRDGVKVKEKVTVVPQGGWRLEKMRDRLVTGYVSCYSISLKTTCYNIGVSFLKASSPYRIVYDQARKDYADRWTKSHAHEGAIRKMNKVFLSHLWEVWREMEGLPTNKIYVEEKLGHTHIYKPEDFGWRLPKPKRKR